MAEIRNYTMNFGPQHPAAHGVLRLVLELDGEVIERADPHIGLLHRATEKLAETRTYLQSLPYMDRLDYVSMMCNEHAYCLAIERLLGIEVPERAQYIRVMFDEITRILNHLLWIGSHSLDVGGMTTFLYAFREREDLFDVYEAVSGARMHAAYYRPGGVYRDLPDRMPQYTAQQTRNARTMKEMNANRQGSLLDFIEDFTQPLPRLRRRLRDAAHREPDLEAAHGRHRRRVAGARDGARASPGRCCAARACRGICARSSRTRSTTGWISTFRSAPTAIATTATSFASRRCGSRTGSSGSASTGCARIPGPVIIDNHKVAPPSREGMKTNMEELIHHFKLFTEGMHVPPGEAYAAIEHPKGEFGVYIISDGANKPYRVKLRAPGLRPSRGARRDVARSHDRRRRRDHRHARHRVRGDRPMSAAGPSQGARPPGRRRAAPIGEGRRAPC